MPTVPRRCVLIATTPRTGSWLLAEALHATDLVGEPQEYFGWEAFAAWSREFGLDTTAPHLRFVEAALAYGTTGNGIFSAKMHFNQLQRFVSRVRSSPGSWPEEPGEILCQCFPDLHCVHLSRADTARQAVSYWKALKLGQWWDVDGAPTPPAEDQEEIDVDFEEIRWCEDFLLGLDRQWRELFARHRIPHLEVVYETFVEDRLATVEAILAFLEVPHDTLTLPPPRLRRQSDDLTEEWLTAYRILRDDLTGVPVEPRWERPTATPLRGGAPA